MFQDLQDSNADVGCHVHGNSPQLRSYDREAQQAIPYCLALGLLCRRVGEVIPFKQDEIKTTAGHQERHHPSYELGSKSPMGLRLSSLSVGRPILASSSSWACFGMGGIRESGHTKNPSGTDGVILNPGWTVSYHPHLGQCGEITKEETTEEAKEGDKERRSKKRGRGFSKEKGDEGETEVLCLEQWKWALWGIAAWSSLCCKSEKRTQVHDMQFPRTSFPILSSEEIIIGKQCPSDARSRSRRTRRDGDDEGSRNRGRRRKRDEHENDEDDRKKDEGDRERDDYNVHEAAGDPKAATEEDYVKSRVFRFLHYFAGPNDPLADALEKAASEEGLRVDIHSVEKKVGSGDLLADEPFRSDLELAKKGKWDGFHAGFPCGTYTRLRFRQQAGMPGPVRTKSEPYGKNSNSRRQQKECDDGTVMAARSITMAKTVASSRKGSVVTPCATLENPPPTDHPEHLSAWELPEMDEFKLMENCSTLVFHTCQYQLDRSIDQRHYKPQMFVGTLLNMRSLTAFCDCEGGPKQHDPVVGKAKSEASGEYPTAFCKAYASLTMQHFRKMAKEEFLKHKMKRLGKEINITKEMLEKKNVTLVPSADVKRTTSTGASSSKDQEDRDVGIPSKQDRKDATRSPDPKDKKENSSEFQGGDGKYDMLKKSTAKSSDPKRLDFFGGMKDPAKVVQPMSNLLSLGLGINAAWEAFCREHPAAVEVAESYGTPVCSFEEKYVDMWKAKLKKVIGAKGAPALRVKGRFEFTSPLDPEMIEGWCLKGNDPEKFVADWIREGAPLGIEKKIPTCGIFPTESSDDLEHRDGQELLDSEAQLARGDIHNYVSVTADVINAKIELERYMKEGYTNVVSRQEMMSTMKHGTISRLGLIVKEKPEGVKRRIIIDLRRSGGNAKASLPEKLVLPRPRDAVESIRSTFAQRQHGKDGTDYARELVVVDISDAFMSLGVHRDELPHTLAPHVEDSDSFYIFSALLFGYKTAPLLWSRVAAMLARMLQSLMTLDEAQHQVYLDDALWILQGSVKTRNINLAMILTTMASLGFRVSLKKGERSTQVQWIGVQFGLHDDILLVTVPKKFISTLLDMFKAWKGMASIKELRIACGRISWLSGLLPRTRWVVSVFYKVLHQRLGDIQSGAEDLRRANRDDDRPKEHLFHVKQLEQPLKWLEVYLASSLEQPVKKIQTGHQQVPEGYDYHRCKPGGLRRHSVGE